MKQTENDEENGEDSDDDDMVSGKQVYVTSADVRDHLRQVWQKDQQVLKCLFNFLSDSETDYPTDAFFIEIIPVPPSRFRPVRILFWFHKSITELYVYWGGGDFILINTLFCEIIINLGVISLLLGCWQSYLHLNYIQQILLFILRTKHIYLHSGVNNSEVI